MLDYAELGSEGEVTEVNGMGRPSEIDERNARFQLEGKGSGLTGFRGRAITMYKLKPSCTIVWAD